MALAQIKFWKYYRVWILTKPMDLIVILPCITLAGYFNNFWTTPTWLCLLNKKQWSFRSDDSCIHQFIPIAHRSLLNRVPFVPYVPAWSTYPNAYGAAWEERAIRWCLDTWCLKLFTSFLMEHTGLTEQLFGLCKMELNIYFLFT